MARQDLIGLRVARWRDTAGLTQQELADRVGVTAAYISMIENGRRAVTKRSLIINLSNALGVRIEDLTAQPVPPRDRIELAIYSAAPAVRRALNEDPDDGPLPNVDDVTRRADAAMRARANCDYLAVAELLPDAIADARRLAADPTTERAGLALTVRIGVTGALPLRDLGHVDLAARLADRAEAAAETLGELVELAAVAFAQGQVALASGAQRRSLAVTSRAADIIGDTVGGDLAAWAGMLRLHAALSAASLGRSDDAIAHWQEAGAAVTRAGGADGWLMEATSANVALWRVAMALENGEPDRAPEYARRVDRAALRLPGRRARLHIDTGRGLFLAGRPDDAVKHFLFADQISSHDVRPRPEVREIVAQMVRDARGRGSDELRDLAVRVGVDPLDPDAGLT